MALEGKRTLRSSIIIVNYNAEDFIVECLRSVVKAVEASRYEHEIILVDNASSDRSVELVRTACPTVRIVQNRENRYIFGLKDGIAASRADTVVFLNNDVTVHEDFLDPLFGHFAQPDVFAVSCRLIQMHSGKEGDSATRSVYSRGVLYWEGVPRVEQPVTTFYLNGGQCAIDRAKFERLGGIDELFWPMYHEDIDLSYRAWKAGYRIIYEPRSVVNHYGGRTSKRVFTPAQLKALQTQNMVLLTCKDFTDPDKIRDLWTCHPLRFLKALATLDLPTVRGYAGAMGRLPRLLASRRAARPSFVRTDREVLELTARERPCAG